MFSAMFATFAAGLLVFVVLMHLCVSQRLISRLKGSTTKVGFFLGRPSDKPEPYDEVVDRITSTSRIVMAVSGLLLAIILIPAAGWALWMIAGLPEYAHRPFVGSGMFYVVMGSVLLILSIVLIGHFTVLYRRTIALGQRST